MRPAIGLRSKIFLVFVMFAISIAAIVVGAALLSKDVLVATGPDQVAGVLFIYGGGAVFLVLALTAGLWLLFDVKVAAPLQSLIRDLQTITHVNPGHTVDLKRGGLLGQLPDAALDICEHLSAARDRTEQAVQDAIAGMEEQKSRLEAILRDLHEGVIVCNLGHQILLYNQWALKSLHIGSSLGLGRSLFAVMAPEPVLHALERLTNLQADEEGPTLEAGALTAPFVSTTVDGRFTLEGQMSLIVDQDKKITGYVLSFDDVTDDLMALGRRDRLLSRAIDGARRPVANLRAAAETLNSNPNLDRSDRAQFEAVINREVKDLSAKLDDMSKEFQAIITSHWPTADIYSANLLGSVIRRLEGRGEVTAMMTGMPHWLHGDSHSLVELMDYLIGRLVQHTGAKTFDLEASGGEHHAYLDVIWDGEPTASGVLDSWLDEPLEHGLGGLTARDVLHHHKTELWSQPFTQGRSRLRLPLPPATRPRRGTESLPSRPEFYDFDLLSRPIATGVDLDRPLRELTYVAFDTETTGLRPSGGDEIVSIAGVRVVNGRILTGESFSQIVDPGRPIPKTSTRFHGVTDEMVQDKPPLTLVLPRFREFVDDAALVAHNAAFDMKFLKLKEGECGVAFDGPVLDTLLLSAFVHDHATDHSLGAVANRFGVAVRGRHTALGDSLVTAGVLVSMFSLLETRGVATLGQAIEASERMVELRARQEEF